MPPLIDRDMNIEHLADEDIRLTTLDVWKALVRRFASDCDLPVGILRMISDPCRSSRPGVDGRGRGGIEDGTLKISAPVPAPKAKEVC